MPLSFVRPFFAGLGGEPVRFFVAPFQAHDRKGQKMKKRQGKIVDGKYSVKIDAEWIEVNEEVYYAFMDPIWQNEKEKERHSRCFIAGKRCQGKCAECAYERNGTDLSLEEMREEGYDVPDFQASVDEQAVKKQLVEALYEELKKLSYRDREIIFGIYFMDKSQNEIALMIGKTQQAVSKRHAALLEHLRSRLASWA